MILHINNTALTDTALYLTVHRKEVTEDGMTHFMVIGMIGEIGTETNWIKW